MNQVKSTNIKDYVWQRRYVMLYLSDDKKANLGIPNAHITFIEYYTHNKFDIEDFNKYNIGFNQRVSKNVPNQILQYIKNNNVKFSFNGISELGEPDNNGIKPFKVIELKSTMAFPVIVKQAEQYLLDQAPTYNNSKKYFFTPERVNLTENDNVKWKINSNDTNPKILTGDFKVIRRSRTDKWNPDMPAILIKIYTKETPHISIVNINRNEDLYKIANCLNDLADVYKEHTNLITYKDLIVYNSTPNNTRSNIYSTRQRMTDPETEEHPQWGDYDENFENFDGGKSVEDDSLNLNKCFTTVKWKDLHGLYKFYNSIGMGVMILITLIFIIIGISIIANGGNGIVAIVFGLLVGGIVGFMIYGIVKEKKIFPYRSLLCDMVFH